MLSRQPNTFHFCSACWGCDLSPRYATISSAGLQRHWWLPPHAHGQPRTPSPPIARLSRTDHASCFTQLVKVSHTFVFHWWRVADRQTVVNFVFFSDLFYSAAGVGELNSGVSRHWTGGAAPFLCSAILFISVIFFHTFCVDVNTSVR